MNKHAHTVHDTHIHTGSTTSVPMYQTPPRTASLSPGSIYFLQVKNIRLISTYYESHIIVIITESGDKSRDLQMKNPKASISVTRMNHTSRRNQLKLNQEQRNSKEPVAFIRHKQTWSHRSLTNSSLWSLECILVDLSGVTLIRSNQ